jgi:hypothetical protein
MIELSLEKQFLLRKFEVLTLPSLNRLKTIELAMSYTYAHIALQYEIKGGKGALSHKCLAEFESTKKHILNPFFGEAMLRAIALEAYGTYLRSLQQLKDLSTNKERN